jgi:hypothetical protein
MPRPSHSSRFCHPHNIGWAIHIQWMYRVFLCACLQLQT